MSKLVCSVVKEATDLTTLNTKVWLEEKTAREAVKEATQSLRKSLRKLKAALAACTVDKAVFDKAAAEAANKGFLVRIQDKEVFVASYKIQNFKRACKRAGLNLKSNILEKLFEKVKTFKEFAPFMELILMKAKTDKVKSLENKIAEIRKEIGKVKNSFRTEAEKARTLGLRLLGKVVSNKSISRYTYLEAKAIAETIAEFKSNLVNNQKGYFYARLLNKVSSLVNKYVAIKEAAYNKYLRMLEWANIYNIFKDSFTTEGFRKSFGSQLNK